MRRGVLLSPTTRSVLAAALFGLYAVCRSSGLSSAPCRHRRVYWHNGLRSPMPNSPCTTTSRSSGPRVRRSQRTFDLSSWRCAIACWLASAPPGWLWYWAHQRPMPLCGAISLASAHGYWSCCTQLLPAVSLIIPLFRLLRKYWTTRHTCRSHISVLDFQPALRSSGSWQAIFRASPKSLEEAPASTVQPLASFHPRGAPLAAPGLAVTAISRC